MLAACKPGGIQAGSVVKMNYVLTVGGKPVEGGGAQGFEFKSGTGQVPPGLDTQLRGLRAGAEKTITVLPDQGYGPADAKKVRALPLTDFGALAKELKLGREVNGLMGGRAAAGRVVALDSETATLDFNHPLAGRTLVFTVKILSVED